MNILTELESMATHTQIMLRNALVTLRGTEPEPGADEVAPAPDSVMERVHRLNTMLRTIKHQSMQLERLVGGA